jgi:Mn2+/Fe2+ NRAMP family transporter
MLTDHPEAALDLLVRAEETATYGDLARHLGIPGPGSIATLAAALEATMEADAAAGRPLRAALLAGRTRDGLPAAGFFEAAARLGRYHGPSHGPEAAEFAAAERRALFNAGPAR